MLLRQKTTTATKELTVLVESGEDIDHGVCTPSGAGAKTMIGCATIGCNLPNKGNLRMILRTRTVHDDVMVRSRAFVRKLSI
jgi:hypothetical protein